MKTSLLAAGCAALCLAGVAGSASARPLRTAAAPAAAAPAIDPATDTRRVCIVDTITGSRVPVRQCQTRAEWVKQGTDPLAAN